MWRYLQIAVLLLGFTQCSAQQQEQLLSPAEADEMMDKKGVVVLDVRTDAEVKRGKIEGAHQHNYFAEDFTAQIKELPKNVIYIVYCKSGSRSAKAAGLMEQLGFKKVYNLQGGYLAWKEYKNKQ